MYLVPYQVSFRFILPHCIAFHVITCEPTIKICRKEMTSFYTIIIFLLLFCYIYAFRSLHNNHFKKNSMKRSFSVDPSLISLGAGSVAGAVGVGVAYPLDTIKTKVQAYAIKSETSLKLKEIVKTILKNEGLQGFYGGVKGVMLAQAFIKSAAFGSNAWALNELASFLGFDPSKPDLIMLALAAAFSGFATSFIVNPIERIKILMQADDSNSYSSEIDCATKVLAQDGLQGLVFRGIDATLIREVPGYALYFIVYSVLINTDISHSLGFYAPLVCGATAGVSSWIPVYPFDVVKT